MIILASLAARTCYSHQCSTENKTINLTQTSRHQSISNIRATQIMKWMYRKLGIWQARTPKTVINCSINNSAYSKWIKTTISHRWMHPIKIDWTMIKTFCNSMPNLYRIRAQWWGHQQLKRQIRIYTWHLIWQDQIILAIPTWAVAQVQEHLWIFKETLIIHHLVTRIRFNKTILLIIMVISTNRLK